MSKLLSDEELLIRLDELVMKCEGTQWIPEHNSYLNDMLNPINTQKRLAVESVIGEDERPAKEASPLMKQLSPNTNRIDWRNELRAEQKARIK